MSRRETATGPQAPYFDVVELAWAGGFFDGEGSTIARSYKGRPGYYQVEVKIPQRGDVAAPAALHRFQSAMRGLGQITPPSSNGVYVWRTVGFEEAQAAIAFLWRFIGPVKRTQAAAALRVTRQQYQTGDYKPKPPRREVHPDPVPARPNSVSPSAEQFERIWSAGFLDAEGCFGLARTGRRKNGTAWFRIRASATQHGDIGVPPAVLTRLHRALEVGRIECHGEPDDFKWLVEGAAGVERVLELTSPWLGPVKLEQARLSLAAFKAQTRLKGNSLRCMRGHEYDYQAVRGGRLRRICKSCARLADRRERAAMGIAPRNFKDVSRRYTS